MLMEKRQLPSLRKTPIFTDKYGRVKVQFDWDAHSKGDENSFTWIRMKQRRGSEQLGAHFTPRVGQEVLVSFDHVDSNKPAIVGAMPSDSSQPPFTPHKTPAQLGLRSKSLASDAMQQAIPGHQLLFDDDSAQPQVHLHSYKDLDVTTNNDYALDVGGKTTTTIKKGDHTQTVGGKYVINAEKAVHIINGESRISITPTDITIEANKISLGGGIKSTSTVSTTKKSANERLIGRLGDAEYNAYDSRLQANSEAGKLIIKHPIDTATLVAGTTLDDAGVGEIIQKEAIDDIAGNEEINISSKDIEANKAIRQRYLNQTKNIKKLDKESNEQNLSLKERARRAWKLRHDARAKARKNMPNKKLVEKLKQKNLAKYGHEDGPTFYSASSENNEYFLRLNDWPDQVLFTLQDEHYNDLINLDGWPDIWIKP